MGPSPGPARARPGPVHFSRDRARNFEKGPSSTQARDRFLEKGLENWDFYVVKIQARQGSGSNFCEGPGLGLGSRSIFKARDRPGIDFLGLDPSLNHIIGKGRTTSGIAELPNFEHLAHHCRTVCKQSADFYH